MASHSLGPRNHTVQRSPFWDREPTNARAGPVAVLAAGETVAHPADPEAGAEGMRWAGRKLEAGGGRKGSPKGDGAQPKQRLGSWIRGSHAGVSDREGGGGRGLLEGHTFEGEKVGDRERGGSNLAHWSEPPDHAGPLPKTLWMFSVTLPSALF